LNSRPRRSAPRARSAAAGGYDGLGSELGGPDTPALGFGCGLERLIMASEGCGFLFPKTEGPRYLFSEWQTTEANSVVSTLVLSLRRLGVSASATCARRSLLRPDEKRPTGSVPDASP
jgi:histidyl-tRNA synthetase